MRLEHEVGLVTPVLDSHSLETNFSEKVVFKSPILFVWVS